MSKKTPRFSLLLLEFLGSMNLAITLLCAVAVASAIGTVLQQNQPYADYLLRFGPFWFEVFNALGLYNIYASSWFLSINAFLVVSTSVCLYRNTPGMLREMRQWQDNVQRRALLGMQQQQSIPLSAPLATVRDQAASLLLSAGYQVRAKSQGDAVLLAAKKGLWNRWGYILTHLSIVVICVGGAMDSSFRFAVKEWLGQLQVETRDIPASDVPAISRLSAANSAFRGNVNLPEGQRADIVFVSHGEGYLVQELPFEIELKDFRIEHYATGQPKSFESDLLIHDPDLPQPLAQTIAVNRPLLHKGLAIYQASFQDGGSELTLKVLPLYGNSADEQTLQLSVFDQHPLSLAGRDFTVEIDDFRLFNINPVAGEQGKSEFKNFGPNFTLRLRNSAGQAIEYQTYQLPLEFDGRFFFTSGMRTSPAEPYQFLHIPADEKFSLARFNAFLHKLHQADAMSEIIYRQIGRTQAERGGEGALEPLARSVQHLLALFLRGGYDAIIQDVQRHVPEARREDVFQAYLKVLRLVMAEAYRELLAEEPTEQQWQFYQSAVDAINTLSQYQSPVFFQLASFKHIQASGLQVTKSPGQFWVYLGCAMLVAGVFMLFYLNRQRLWLWLDEDSLLFAGQGHRKTDDFPREFAQLGERLAQLAQHPGSDTETPTR